MANVKVIRAKVLHYVVRLSTLSHGTMFRYEDQEIVTHIYQVTNGHALVKGEICTVNVSTGYADVVAGDILVVPVLCTVAYADQLQETPELPEGEL